jgi:NAD(P)-dependent dehydrogenase (short-subunit alcohol dehydrogenase family)
MTRVCLLTGAGGTLGDAFCRTLAADYNIVAVHRSEPPLVSSQDAWLFDPLAPRRTVPETEHPVFTVQADLRDHSDVERVVELALARFDQVDLLVNAAADVTTTALTTTPERVEEWEEQLRLNAVVPVHLAATLADVCWRPHHAHNRQRSRNVVNVTSTAGLGSAPGTGRGFYGASKAALTTLTRQMAQEYAQLGVRVNAVAPTFFPQVVPTSHVVDAVTRLDRGSMTGRVLVLEAHGSRWV